MRDGAAGLLPRQKGGVSLLKVFDGWSKYGKTKIIFESGLCLLYIGEKQRAMCYEDEAAEMVRRWKREYGIYEQREARRIKVW